MSTISSELLAKIATATLSLGLLLPAILTAQKSPPRESSDPYFKAPRPSKTDEKNQEAQSTWTGGRLKPQNETLDANSANSQSSDANPGQQFQPGQVLAVVGGEPIFVADMMLDINQLVERFMPTAPDSIKEQQKTQLIKRLLPKYIDQKLMLVDTLRNLPEGAEFDKIIVQAEKEFDDKALDTMMKEAGVKSPTEFDAQLRAQGSSLRKLRHSWSVDQLVRFFATQRLKVNVDVTHQEMLGQYRSKLDAYEIKAKARWQQVMVKFTSHPSKLDARKEIIKLGNQIVYGASMEAIAKNESDGFRADEGGVHDWTNEGSLVLKELNSAIFSLPVGELSDIIETSQGLHIVRVLERQDATRKSFLEAQADIREQLENEKRETAFQDHLAKLRREIPVEILGEADGMDSAEGVSDDK